MGKRSSFVRKVWTEAEKDRLRELAGQGFGLRAIAAELGRSYGSVKERAHVMGVTYSVELKRELVREATKAAAARPENRRRLVEQCRANARKPEQIERARALGRWATANILRDPEVKARNRAACGEGSRRYHAARMAWLPHAKRQRYASLRSMHSAATAKEMILAELAAEKAAEVARIAALTPFERQLERAKKVGFIERPRLVANDYSYSLIGSSLAL